MRHPLRSISNWLLLAVMAVHFVIAHHDGVSELLLTRYDSGEVVVESVLSHALADHHVPHADHQPEQELAHNAEHHGPHSEHLVLYHPEDYLPAVANVSSDLHTLAWTLSALVAQPELQSPLGWRSAVAVFARQPQPPPLQRQAALTTTVLLI
ncbi:MAG: hypothetical protein ACO1RX_23410 [Candidatus Sericytochromatia bacterium]